MSHRPPVQPPLPATPRAERCAVGTRDKYENEELIKHGWEEDVWFHVDKHSSAHVYVRLPRGPIRKQFRETGRLDHLPPGALEDLCQLTKANSIEGCKVTCDIVYTAWENLHKRGDMDTGTIGFKDQKKVIKVQGVERIKEISNRIEKTKTEEFPDFAAVKAQHMHELQAEKKKKAKQLAKVKRQEAEAARQEKDARDYKHVMQAEKMTTNAEMDGTVDTSAAAEFEEDFM